MKCEFCGASLVPVCEPCSSRKDQQQELNIQFLLDCLDRVHGALCPEHEGTWQERSKHVAEIAEMRSGVFSEMSMANEGFARRFVRFERCLGEARGALSRIATEAAAVLQDGTVSEVPNSKRSGGAGAGEDGR